MLTAAAHSEPLDTLAALLASCGDVTDRTMVMDLPDEVIARLGTLLGPAFATDVTFCEWLVMQALDPTEQPLTVGMLKTHLNPEANVGARLRAMDLAETPIARKRAPTTAMAPAQAPERALIAAG